VDVKEGTLIMIGTTLVLFFSAEYDSNIGLLEFAG
jgi:hypothetical protein